jgi:hypothetical protein
VKYAYFTLHGSIPGLSPQFLVGNLLQTGILHGESIGKALSRLQVIYGDVFQFWLGPSRCIVLSNAEDIQHVFRHRQIYDHANMLAEKITLLFPDALLNIRGDYIYPQLLTVSLTHAV